MTDTDVLLFAALMEVLKIKLSADSVNQIAKRIGPECTPRAVEERITAICKRGAELRDGECKAGTGKPSNVMTETILWTKGDEMAALRLFGTHTEVSPSKLAEPIDSYTQDDIENAADRRLEAVESADAVEDSASGRLALTEENLKSVQKEFEATKNGEVQ